MYKTPKVLPFSKTYLTKLTSKGAIWPYYAESAIKLQSINHFGDGDQFTSLMSEINNM